jgi:hypothetical protein
MNILSRCGIPPVFNAPEVHKSIFYSQDSARTQTATINRQSSLPFTIWDKQPTFQDVALAEVSDFFAAGAIPEEFDDVFIMAAASSARRSQ